MKIAGLIEANQIYNEDCVVTMNRMSDGFIDLVVTSPPYDDLRRYDGYSFNFEDVAQELYRVVKHGGIVIWVVGDATRNGSESGTSFKQALRFKELGFNLHDTMIYRKLNYIPLTHRRYEQEFEYMFCFAKGSPTTFNPIMVDCKTSGSKTTGRTFYQTNSQNRPSAGHKNDAVKEHKIKGNVWEFATNGKVKGHPAQFPEQLANDHILSWSNEGELVYDPFMGSGTVATAAIRLNRRFIGSEISEGYCTIANDRIEVLRNKCGLFGTVQEKANKAA